MNLQDLWTKLKTMLNNPGQQQAQTTQGQQVAQSGRPTDLQGMLQQLQAGRQSQANAVAQQQNMAQAVAPSLQGQNPGLQTFMQNVQGAGQGLQNFAGQAQQAAMQNPMIQKLLQMLHGGQ